MAERPTQSTVDLADDVSLLAVGWDYNNTRDFTSISSTPVITFKRPSNRDQRTMPIYIGGNGPFKIKAYLDVVGLMPTVFSLLAQAHQCATGQRLLQRGCIDTLTLF